nr:uncharacterized protein LOC110438559 isoform X5 [Danio rerio]XP_021331771.1 uncharacterized protein LOC100332745 isoform X3 [Danio rerio]|eukprot:XP_021326808.1 uncharacterized protein LOC110438559 isoform X5 [Danio rerio]
MEKRRTHTEHTLNSRFQQKTHSDAGLLEFGGVCQMGENRSRSRSRSSAFIQAAVQDVRTHDGDGETQTVSQELDGFLAPLPSPLAKSVSTDQGNRKRKRQSGSQQTPEDERPSTSSRRALKRSRRDAYAKGPLLGDGGFGSVFAGMRRSDGLPVAIKYVSKERTQRRLRVVSSV